jgi:D-amino-acid oxidase
VPRARSGYGPFVRDVTVVGAGVMGLSTAICLAEAGVRVAVHAAEAPDQTTSAAAGALWGPHLVGADDRIGRWAEETRLRLLDLLTFPFVQDCSGIAAEAGDDADESRPPEVAETASDVTVCPPDEVPPGYAVAWRFRAPLVSMPEYLGYLHERYLAAGGAPIVAAEYPSLADAARAAGGGVLVNCAGSGARTLVPDPDVVAVRGQIVIASNPGITEFFVGAGHPAHELTYVFPHDGRLVLGGTEVHDDWRTDPDPGTAEQILAACTAAVPALAGATVLGHRVGLRPYRPAVRLETERAADGTVIVHNYGHGGSGVTLSWGCAQDAAALAIAALDAR